MVKLNLSIKVQLENLTGLQPEDPINHQFFFKVKCSSCHEVHQNWIEICRAQDYPLSGSRGTANFVWKCQFCKREASASFTDLQSKSFPIYTESHSSEQKFQTLCTLECRGCEFTEVDLRGHWICKGKDSKTEFKEIEFDDGEWYDYDEKAGQPVSITGIETKIARA